MRMILRTLLSRLASGGLPHVVLATVVQQAVAVLGVLAIAKLLSPADFGLVRIAMAYVAVAVVVGAGGLTTPVLRYCADPRFDDTDRRSLLGAGLQRLAPVALGTCVASLLLILLSGRDRQESIVFSAYALQIPALAATSVLMVYFQAVHRFRFFAWYQVAARLLTVILTVAATWIFGLAGLLVAAIVAAIFGMAPLVVAARPLLRKVQSLPQDFGSLAGFSLIGMLISTIGQYADILLLDSVGTDPRLVAVYSLATIFFFALSSLAGAVQAFVTPKFTSVIHDPAAFRARLRTWTVGLAAAAVPAGLTTCALAWSIERWFLGPAYAGLGMMVGILMLRFVIWCTYAVGGAALVGIGAIKQGTWIAGSTTLLAFVVGFPLCAEWNVWGAAWTQVVVALASALLVARLVRREVSRLQPAKSSGGT